MFLHKNCEVVNDKYRTFEMGTIEWYQNPPSPFFLEINSTGKTKISVYVSEMEYDDKGIIGQKPPQEIYTFFISEHESTKRVDLTWLTQKKAHSIAIKAKGLEKTSSAGHSIYATLSAYNIFPSLYNVFGDGYITERPIISVKNKLVIKSFSVPGFTTNALFLNGTRVDGFSSYQYTVDGKNNGQFHLNVDNVGQFITKSADDAIVPGQVNILFDNKKLNDVTYYQSNQKTQDLILNATLESEGPLELTITKRTLDKTVSAAFLYDDGSWEVSDGIGNRRYTPEALHRDYEIVDIKE